MRSFDAIVQTLVRPMISIRGKIADRPDVASQLVDDHDPRRAKPANQPLQEPSGGLHITPLLHAQCRARSHSRRLPAALSAKNDDTPRPHRRQSREENGSLSGQASCKLSSSRLPMEKPTGKQVGNPTRILPDHRSRPYRRIPRSRQALRCAVRIVAWRPVPVVSAMVIWVYCRPGLALTEVDIREMLGSTCDILPGRTPVIESGGGAGAFQAERCACSHSKSLPIGSCPAIFGSHCKAM